MCENLTFLGVCVCLNVCILYVCVRVNAGVCRCANQKRYFQDFFASLGQNYYTHKQKAITALLPTAPQAHHSIHETHTLSDPQPLIIISVRARACVCACVRVHVLASINRLSVELDNRHWLHIRCNHTLDGDQTGNNLQASFQKWIQKLKEKQMHPHKG